MTVVIVREDLLAGIPDGLPRMLDYRTYAEHGSMYNTPPVFADLHVAARDPVAPRRGRRPRGAGGRNARRRAAVRRIDGAAASTAATRDGLAVADERHLAARRRGAGAAVRGRGRRRGPGGAEGTPQRRRDPREHLQRDAARGRQVLAAFMHGFARGTAEGRDRVPALDDPWIAGLRLVGVGARHPERLDAASRPRGDRPLC